MAVAAARAAAQAVRLVQASANPYVMVKHGRREGRAAAYDRFMAACSGVFYDGSLDRAGTTELLVARMAVEVRAPGPVRDAAERLFRQIVGRDWGYGGISPTGWVKLDDAEVEAQLAATLAEWRAGRCHFPELLEDDVPPETDRFPGRVAGGVRDDGGVLGVGLGLAGVEVGDPAHGESWQVGDLTAGVPGDGQLGAPMEAGWSTITKTVPGLVLSLSKTARSLGWPCSRIVTANGHVALCDCCGRRFPSPGASLS